jgi:DNA-binding NarL/FixJ family response regulator
MERPKLHSVKEIRERREKILLLMSRGYNQGDIARELGTTRQTICKDMKTINEMTNKGLYNFGKSYSSHHVFQLYSGT